MGFEEVCGSGTEKSARVQRFRFEENRPAGDLLALPQSCISWSAVRASRVASAVHFSDLRRYGDPKYNGRMADTRIKDQASSGEAFKALSKEQQELYGCIVRELLNFAQGHALPMCFAPPLVTATVPLATGPIAVKLPLTLGKVDGASGCVLQLQSGYFFVTAEHVLAEYEKRTREGERLNWQIGKLPPFDPISRIAWRDKTDAYERSQMPYRSTDIVLLRLTKEEAEEACGEARIVPTPARWPPPPLSIWPTRRNGRLSKPATSCRSRGNDEPEGLRPCVPGHEHW